MRETLPWKNTHMGLPRGEHQYWARRQTAPPSLTAGGAWRNPPGFTIRGTELGEKKGARNPRWGGMAQQAWHWPVLHAHYLPNTREETGSTRSLLKNKQRGAVRQCMGGGNTPGGVSPHGSPCGWYAKATTSTIQWANLCLETAFPFCCPQWQTKSCSELLTLRVRSTYMRNALTGHSNAKAESASSEGSACRFTTWSRKGMVGTLGTYPGRGLKTTWE